MRHNQLENGGHWAVAESCVPGMGVLVQIQDNVDGQQARVLLTKDEAWAMATELSIMALKLEQGGNNDANSNRTG